MPNIETQKVKPFGQVDDPRLFLREGQAAFFQPLRQDALHTLGVFPGFTKAHKIIGISHHCPFANELAPVVVFDPDSLFHAVKGNVGQQGRHHAALRRSLLRCVDYLLFDIACFEPLFHEFRSCDRATSLEQRVVRDVIESAASIRVQDPFLGLVWTSYSEDFLAGVMSTAPRSKSVACSLNPGFPGWFKGIFDQCLKAAIHHDGYPEWPQLVVGFGDVDSSHWLGFPGGGVGERIDHSSSGVLMTSLSTPGVCFPALICATRRTLTSRLE